MGEAGVRGSGRGERGPVLRMEAQDRPPGEPSLYHPLTQPQTERSCFPLG